MDPTDAFFYVIFQVGGGALGIVLVYAVLGQAFAHPSANCVATAPGAHGVSLAFVADIIGVGAHRATLYARVSSA